jgi:hypothetical protein
MNPYLYLKTDGSIHVTLLVGILILASGAYRPNCAQFHLSRNYVYTLSDRRQHSGSSISVETCHSVNQ